jgi:hypothetical protein
MEMIAVEPEKQRSVFTSQIKIQQTANFYSWGAYKIATCVTSIRTVSLRKK